jgi:hypothetical protein
MFKPGHKKAPGSGRKRGQPNKTTVDIKALICQTVDFATLNTKMAELAAKGNVQAARLLYEYGFGKPTQTINATISTPDRDEAKRAFAEIFGTASRAFISPSGELVSGPEPVQDSEQGAADRLLNGDRSGGNGQGGVPR